MRHTQPRSQDGKYATWRKPFYSYSDLSNDIDTELRNKQHASGTKKILLVISFVIIIVGTVFAIVTYPERASQVNANAAAANGYEPDFQTPLAKGDSK